MSALYKVYTFQEAAELWGLGESTLRSRAYRDDFLPGETRKSGDTWLVTEEAMRRIYGKPEMERFFDCETHRVDKGYIIHYTNDPYFPTQAVVEDADGNMEMIDLGYEPWEGLDEFLDLVIEKYEEVSK